MWFRSFLSARGCIEKDIPFGSVRFQGYCHVILMIGEGLGERCEMV